MLTMNHPTHQVLCDFNLPVGADTTSHFMLTPAEHAGPKYLLALILTGIADEIRTEVATAARVGIVRESVLMRKDPGELFEGIMDMEVVDAEGNGVFGMQVLGGGLSSGEGEQEGFSGSGEGGASDGTAGSSGSNDTGRTLLLDVAIGGAILNGTSIFEGGAVGLGGDVLTRTSDRLKEGLLKVLTMSEENLKLKHKLATRFQEFETDSLIAAIQNGAADTASAEIMELFEGDRWTLLRGDDSKRKLPVRGNSRLVTKDMSPADFAKMIIFNVRNTRVGKPLQV